MLPTSRSALRASFLGGFCAVVVLALVLAVWWAVLRAHEVDAARNGSGTYSLPYSPVVTHTTIQSTWANGTTADIATELTNSLDRNGRGAMLAPLQLVNGTSSAPALTWATEPTSGPYRKSLNTFDWQVGSTTSAEFKNVSPGLAAPIGLSVTQTTTNGNGINSTANGSGVGVNAVGGSTSGTAVFATGGAPNGIALSAQGSGNGYGLSAIGGATAVGIATTGGGANAGLSAANGTSATGGTRQDAVVLSNGDLDLHGVANVTSTTAIVSRLTPSNIVKAWGEIASTTGVVTAGFNIASAACASKAVTVTYGSPGFAGAASYVALVGFAGTEPGAGLTRFTVSQTATTAVINGYQLDSGQITLSGGGTGSATVHTGAICTCTDNTSNSSVKCSVTTTTLNAVGTGTDVINYNCNQGQIDLCATSYALTFMAVGNQ